MAFLEKLFIEIHQVQTFGWAGKGSVTSSHSLTTK